MFIGSLHSLQSLYTLYRSFRHWKWYTWLHFVFIRMSPCLKTFVQTFHTSTPFWFLGPLSGLMFNAIMLLNELTIFSCSSCCLLSYSRISIATPLRIPRSSSSSTSLLSSFSLFSERSLLIIGTQITNGMTRKASA